MLLWIPPGADASDAILVPYPSSDQRSVTLGAEVDGVSVPVSQFGDIDFVQFAIGSAADLAVRRLDGSPIESGRVRPAHLDIRAQVAGPALSLPVAPGQKLVINVDHLRKLFVFVERMRPERASADVGRVQNVVARGADATGQTDSTRAIQSAIDAVHRGGTVHIPAGRYRVGSLQLKSHMTLDLAPGALLLGGPDHHQIRRYRDGEYLYLLLAERVENLTIQGCGIIDANGFALRRAWEEERARGRREAGRLLLAVDARNLHLRDVTLRDSFSWTAHLVNCRESSLSNVKILADTRHSNVDGLDVDGCRELTVDDVFIYAEDDAISIKAAWSRNSPEHLAFRNCVLWSQNATGIRLGTETHARAFRDISFENTTILRANTMIRFFNYHGALIEDVTFRKLWTEELTLSVSPKHEEARRVAEVRPGESHLFQMLVRKDPDQQVGAIQNVLFEDVQASEPGPSMIKGYDVPETQALISNVTFRRLGIAGRAVENPEQGRFKLSPHVADLRFEPE
jgi:hypothetical protein